MRWWTAEEVEYLKDKWGEVSISTLAKKMDRTVYSVKNKAFKIGLGNFIQQGDYVTFKELLDAIGQGGNYSYLKMRLERDGFPIKYKKVINNKFAIVYINDFWKWTEKNKQKINFAKFEEGALGKEPNWVAEKRRADLLNPSKTNHNRKWTLADDDKLMYMCKSCRYTYKDIADELNRTQAAVKRRLYDLKVPYRPVPLDNHKKWTEEENMKMLDLYKKGYDCYSIATMLNKTNLSICDRLRIISSEKGIQLNE